LFDQFADDQNRNTGQDDATVSLPAVTGGAQRRDEADGDAPTETLNSGPNASSPNANSPNRTITLPGDTTGPLPTTAGAHAADRSGSSSDTRPNEDDTPTGVLPPS
jgi:hypothetical protein